MLAVRVDPAAERVLVLQRVGIARRDARAETAVDPERENVGAVGARNLGRAIRGTVVDDEHVRLGQLRPQLVEHGREVVLLVPGRQEDERVEPCVRRHGRRLRDVSSDECDRARTRYRYRRPRCFSNQWCAYGSSLNARDLGEARRAIERDRLGERSVGLEPDDLAAVPTAQRSSSPSSRRPSPRPRAARRHPHALDSAGSRRGTSARRSRPARRGSVRRGRARAAASARPVGRDAERAGRSRSNRAGRAPRSTRCRHSCASAVAGSTTSMLDHRRP